jgi:hypothetical protein
MGCFDLALMVLCLMLACLPCSFDEITLSGRSGSWQGPSFDTPRPMVDDECKDDGRRTITFFSWGTGHASRTISVRMNATGLTRRDRTTCTKLETRKTKQSFIYGFTRVLVPASAHVPEFFTTAEAGAISESIARREGLVTWGSATQLNSTPAIKIFNFVKSTAKRRNHPKQEEPIEFVRFVL